MFDLFNKLNIPVAEVITLNPLIVISFWNQCFTIYTVQYCLHLPVVFIFNQKRRNDPYIKNNWRSRSPFAKIISTIFTLLKYSNVPILILFILFLAFHTIFLQINLLVLSRFGIIPVWAKFSKILSSIFWYWSVIPENLVISVSIPQRF